MKLEKKHYIMAALVLGVLATWGARERSWSKRVEALTTSETVATAAATSATAKVQSLELQLHTEVAKAYERGRRTSKETLPNGTVRETTEDFERSSELAKAEIALKQLDMYKAELVQAHTAVTNLSHRVNELELEVVKQAPRWAAKLGWEPLADDELQKWRGGLGVNVFGWSVLLNLAPAASIQKAAGGEWGQALKAGRPELEGVLRF